MTRSPRLRSLFFAPVFDQCEELPALLTAFRATALPCDELLLVNNGSTDGSAELIHASGFPYLDLPRNLGVGGAFMAAADYAIERGFDVLGAIAGNGKMLPAEMHRVLDPVVNGSADYVTGSRYLPGGSSPNLTRFRGLAIPAVTLAVQLLTGRRITDATCGYRCYRLDILKRATFDWHAPWLEGYGFEYYLYAHVLQDRSIRSIEVPVTMQYPPSGRRHTKIRAFVGWWDMFKPFLVARFDGQGFRPGDATS